MNCHKSNGRPPLTVSGGRAAYPEARVPWTKARLEALARTRLGGARLIVVANREPYQHHLRDGRLGWARTVGGLATALDPVMRACGGVWVALGCGAADRGAARRSCSSRTTTSPSSPGCSRPPART